MVKFNKLTLFILMFITSTCAGISLYLVNWEVVKSGQKVFQELQLPLIFIFLSFYFMVPYVKKLKEEHNKSNHK